MTEKPEVEKSEARLYTVTVWEKVAKEGEVIQRIAQILDGMEDFCHSKKNMFLPIREGIAKKKEELDMLLLSNGSHKIFLLLLEHFLGAQVAKDKEAQMRCAKRQADLVNEEF